MDSAQQDEQKGQFEAVKTRLEEIAREVDDENLSLDEALDLYEEAVKLGLQASDLLEVGIEVEEVEGPSADAMVGSAGTNSELSDSAQTNDNDVASSAATSGGE